MSSTEDSPAGERSQQTAAAPAAEQLQQQQQKQQKQKDSEEQTDSKQTPSPHDEDELSAMLEPADESLDLDTPRAVEASPRDRDSEQSPDVQTSVEDAEAFCAIDLPSTSAAKIKAGSASTYLEGLSDTAMTELQQYVAENLQMACVVTVQAGDAGNGSGSALPRVRVGFGLLHYDEDGGGSESVSESNGNGVFEVEWQTLAANERDRVPLVLGSDTEPDDATRKALVELIHSQWTPLSKAQFTAATGVEFPESSDDAEARKRKGETTDPDDGGDKTRPRRSNSPSNLPSSAAGDELDIVALTYEDYVQAHKIFHAWARAQPRGPTRGGYHGSGGRGPPRGCVRK